MLYLLTLKGLLEQARRFGVLSTRPVPPTVRPHAVDGESDNFDGPWHERALGKLKKVRDTANDMDFCSR